MFNFNQKKIEKAKAEAERVEEEAEARELEIFDAAAVIGTGGEISPKRLFRKAKAIYDGITREYGGYKIYIHFPHYDDSSGYQNCAYQDFGFLDMYEDADDWGVVTIRIGLNRDTIFYSAAREYKSGKWLGQERVRSFQNGEWVEHLLSYSKEVCAKYEMTKSNSNVG